jgi:hypothetical protein
MSSTGDDHTKNIHTWLRQVLADRSLDHAAFKAAYVIAEHINRRKHYAYGGYERYAAMAHVAVRTMRYWLDQLVAKGHLAVTVSPGGRRPGRRVGRKGTGHANEYRLTFKQPSESDKPADQRAGSNLQIGAHVNCGKPAVPTRVNLQTCPLPPSDYSPTDNSSAPSLPSGATERARDARHDGQISGKEEQRGTVAAEQRTEADAVRSWNKFKIRAVRTIGPTLTERLIASGRGVVKCQYVLSAACRSGNPRAYVEALLRNGGTPSLH